jgi:hypothetical protein
MPVIVHVTWRDAQVAGPDYFDTPNGWIDRKGLEEFIDNSSSIMATAGLLLAEQEDKIVIGQTIGRHPEVYSEVVSIPRGQIVEIARVGTLMTRGQRASLTQ